MNIPKFVTLGCRLNTYETEAMRELAKNENIENIAVVNTCAVTAEAVRKSKQEIRKIHRENPTTKIIVTGCAAQVEPETFAKMSEVSNVFGNIEKMKTSTWKKLSKELNFIGKTERIQVDDIMSAKETAGHLIDGFGTRSRAYVQVQNGCDHRCTFCIIPYGRGNSRSVAAGIIIEQIKRLVGNGFKEIVLTGVDLTSWGSDLPSKPKLGDLVLKILKLVPDLARLRISSIDSIEVDENLMEAIANEARLMPHFHLSLQSGDNMILKRMKRRHLRDDAILFCETVRKIRPEITFGADIIAGFPTETDDMFENSMQLVNECDLTWLHIFPYSPRQGTPASRMPQVNGIKIKERAKLLRSLGATQVSKYLNSQIGKYHNILMESESMGRTEQFAEVDFQNPQQPGEITFAKIEKLNNNRLMV
ncbi:tRNA (N(6)-L-threonylcarbamoyladenosine(37)-C(2))-methylthiotransferase MtaB [Paracoccaceae bacterium]|jgi:threonylcarbamoyladenosine tRNA methylthiotransferase MtaB|nr:tRNA (N(6)-L-threonylcarbamoyladenosine(37)-C(2))-methylthiotransferase MtaB [Paracoccaceae bacterium]|tara:strand:- start:2408 stop:3667 length:1260 start_codon:yes stop_codon:yes gene_type:complete